MLKTSTAALLLGSVLLSGSAFAQAPQTSTTTTSSSTTSMSTNAGQWRASKVVGLSVYNDANESLGSINELLVDNSGKVQGVIIGVGGFLGIGERNISVTWDKLKWVNEPMRTAATTTTTAPGTAITTGSAMSPTAPAAPAPGVRTDRNWYPDHAMLSTTKDELKSFPEFKY